MSKDLSTASAQSKFYDFYQFAHQQAEGGDEFPFKTRISLLPFVEQLRTLSQDPQPAGSIIAKSVLNRIESHPELMAPELSAEVLAGHQDILSLALSLFFNPLLPEPKMGYIVSPFSNQVLYATPDFIQVTQSGEYEIGLESDKEEILQKMLANAYSVILARLYDKKFEPAFPGGFTIRHKETKLEQHFQINVVPDFVEIEVVKSLPPVAPEEIARYYQKRFDASEWLELLPPEHFEFHGALIIYLTDITQQETKARIKNRLLGKESGQPELDIPYLRTQVRSFFRMPDLQIGFQQHQPILREIMSAYGSLSGLLDRIVSMKAFEGSIYGTVKETRAPVIVEDLKELSGDSEVVQILLENGIRGLLLIPILQQDGQEIGGILELGSPQPGALSHFHLRKIRGLLPIFSAGLDRKKEEMDNRLRKIIQQQFTNIHSSVQWKFTEVSLDLLRKQMSDTSQQHKMPPLLFQRVYPLYGQADIIGSSANRNEAILADLCLNLDILARLLDELSAQRPAHLLEYFRHQVDKILEDFKQGFSPSDETRVLNLLKLDIHPYLQELSAEATPEMQVEIAAYFNELHQPLDVMYRKRKDFEDSVARLNESVSSLIQEEDERMQTTLPHYFEKYKTDGVEYNIYLGQSLLQNRAFSENHLREFRLWQLKLMVRITRLVHRLQNELPMPLHTSQLIFVYSDQLDIRFRLDEKRFDVDGAYNVRYEILKKRIDKAHIEGTQERLTQEGKIAIVYLHPENHREYRAYLDFLTREGWIEPEVEELNLARMQGVEGLKALRVKVRM